MKKLGYEVGFISGVPSFCAAAARLGRPLVSGNDSLHVIPSADDDWKKLGGVKVIMKPSAGAFGLEGISENVSGIFSYRELMKENEELRDEIDELKEEMNRMSLNEEELEDLRELSAALNYDFIGSSDDIVTATIISFDGLNWTNIFTINRGSDSGIEEGDVVICGDGLVGRVSQTGRNWAKVMSLIDESVKISFKSEDDTDMLGIIEGTSDGELSGYMLEEKSKIKEGSRLVTSGVGMYPDGIDIGRVSEVWYDSDTQLTRIKVTPSVDFMALDKVSVVL